MFGECTVELTKVLGHDCPMLCLEHCVLLVLFGSNMEHFNLFIRESIKVEVWDPVFLLRNGQCICRGIYSFQSDGWTRWLCISWSYTIVVVHSDCGQYHIALGVRSHVGGDACYVLDLLQGLFRNVLFLFWQRCSRWFAGQNKSNWLLQCEVILRKTKGVNHSTWCRCYSDSFFFH